MSVFHPDSDFAGEESEEQEREQLKEMLGKIAAASATMEGFLAATEARLDDPAKQEERERQRAATREAIAGVEGDFAEIRRELRAILGQPYSDPLGGADHQ